MGVYRANLNLRKLRTHLYRAAGAGRSNDALRSWLAERGFWPEGDRWLGEASALEELPCGVVTDRGEIVQPKPLQDDPRYDLIFEAAEKDWEFFCRERDEQSDAWQVALIEEYIADDDLHCSGPVLRAWCRDEEGLREISEAERLAHHRAAVGRPVYPFTLLTFRLGPGRDRVVLGHRYASTGGSGGLYLISRTTGRLELVPDPNGGFWRS